MKKKDRILALLMTLVLLMQIFSGSAFAEEAGPQPEEPAVIAGEPTGEPAQAEAPEVTEEETEIGAQTAPEPAHVLFEVDGLRKEAEKHFRMSDGSFLAVSFGSNIHYLDSEGSWQNIDNTMTLQPSGLTDTEAEVYRSVNGEESREFAAVLNQTGYLFSASSGAASLSFYAASADDTEPQFSAEAKVSYPIPDGGDGQGLSLAEQVTPEHFSAEISYADVWKDTDLVYAASGMNVKESIVVSAPQQEYRYRFHMVPEGLTPVQNEDGSLTLCADDEAVFELPAPFMLDADGACSDAAAYTLVPTDGGYLLTVTADADWMNDPSRVFPVTIDPTVVSVTSYSNKNIITSYVNSGRTTTASYLNKAYLRSGYYTNTSHDPYCTGYTVGLLYVNNLPTVPEGCVVTNAELGLMQILYGGTTHENYFMLYGTTLSAPSNPESYLNTMTWNKYNSEILNYYTKGVNSSENAALDFMHEAFHTGVTDYYDITGIAQKWYDSSTPVSRLLVLDDGHNNAYNARVTYAGYYPTQGGTAPTLYVTYRNVVGMESIYSSHTQSVGRAGTGYLNDYTLNLSFSVPVLSAPSQVLPFSLSLVYNGPLCYTQFSSAANLHTANYTTAKAGYGWKTSLQQTVKQASAQIGSSTQTLLVYTDADGTEHYFYPQSGSSTVYEDEDGLNLTITASSSSHTMKDKDNNQWFFTYGYLTQFTSSEGNNLYYAYNGQAYSADSSSWKPSSSSSAHRVTGVWRENDGGTLEKIATLSYDESGQTNYLTSVTDKAGRTTSFTYGSGKLIGIAFPDGETATYNYTEWTSASNVIYYRLFQALDGESGYRMRYSYDDTNHLRVYTVMEETCNSENTWIIGEKIRCYRTNPAYTRFRYFSQSESLESNGHLVTQRYSDNWGRTFNVITMNADETETLGVSTGEYTDNSGSSKKNNRLIHDASCGVQGTNILINGNLEHSTDLYNWYKGGTGNAAAAANTNTTTLVTPHNGNKLMKIYVNNLTTGYEYCVQSVYLQANQTYVFSGYVNTACTDAFASDGSAYLSFMDASGSTHLAKSRAVNYKTNLNMDGGWERLEVSYTPSTSGTYIIEAIANHLSEIVAFDDFQLEKVPSADVVDGVAAASAYNLLQISSFELPNSSSGTQSTSSVSSCWSYNSSASVPTSIGAHTGGYSMTTLPLKTGKRRVSQVVPINGSSDKTYILSGWGKTPVTKIGNDDNLTGDNDDAKRFFGMIAKVNYTDGSTPDYHYVSFNDDVDQWQFASGVVVPAQKGKTVSTIVVSLALDYCVNRVCFDDISLIQEPVQTYEYDTKGNLISATNSEGKTESELDSYDRLTGYTAMNGVEYALTYQNNSTRNPQTVTSDGVKTTYGYDAAGNVTQTRIRKSDGTGKYVQTDATYDSTKNFPATVTDSTGQTAQSDYDTSTGVLTESVNPKLLHTFYSYISTNDRPLCTYQNSIAALTNCYDTKGRIQQITRKSLYSQIATWQAYNFSYDTWGNTTAVCVWHPTGDTDTDIDNYLTLVSYAYNANGQLSRMTYPNGDYVLYQYDILDRLTGEMYYNSANTLQISYYYVYSPDGRLARQYARQGGTVTESYSFAYDSLGRLIRSREETGTATVQRTEHLYDTANRLTRQDWSIGSVGFSEQYTYNDPSLNGTLKDGSLKTFQISTTVNGTTSYDKLHFSYDALKRLTSVEDRENDAGTLINTRQYVYEDLSGDRTTNQLKQLTCRKPSDSSIISGNRYSYDANGNIEDVYEVFTVSGSDQSRLLAHYTYDGLNQLLTETRYTYSGNSTTPTDTTVIEYSTDTAGNIRWATTKVNGVQTGVTGCTYGNPYWADMLTAVTVDGTSKTISYSSYGNPLSWYNGTEYTNLTWIQGRRLSSLKKGTADYSFTYDMSGVRTSKIAEGKKHEYVTQNGRVVRETVTGYPSGTFLYMLDFTYDESGNPLTMRKYNNEALTSYATLHYICNAQGDVVKLVYGSSNTVYASYTYDAWGRVLTATGSYAEINPLRYRGYYYDSETGFYYLQSRYYDPIVKRFLNADSYGSTGQGFLGYNMFAYCDNNPLGHKDSQGGRMQNVGMTDGGGLMLTSKQDVKVTYNDSAASSLSKEKVNYYTRTYTPGFNSYCSVSSNGALTYQNHSVANTAQMVNDIAGGVSTLYSFLNKASGSVVAAEYVAVVAVPVGVVLEMHDNLKVTDDIPDGKYNSYTIMISGTRATSFPYEGHTVEHYTITLEIYEDQKNYNTYLAGYDCEEVYTYYGR